MTDPSDAPLAAQWSQRLHRAGGNPIPRSGSHSVATSIRLLYSTMSPNPRMRWS